MSGGFLILLVAMFGFLYFLLIRPQRAQQRKHADLLGSLKPGDEVVTTGGIYGEVVPLGSIDSCEAGPGDRLIVETPGGGGYGAP